MHLAGLGTLEQRRAFLDNDWQQEHRFFPAALTAFSDPVTADDLAALALMPEVESRIVEGKELRTSHGPFSSERLEDFPTSNATLLVQAVDQFDPEVAELLSTINFIPGWRKDDVMVSFSTPGGGVGPHFDEYDVFLVQGEGQRNWRIGQHCNEATEVDTSSGHRVIKHFETIAEYTMSAGDVLYVPPGVAHWGVSIDNSLTYSIGFRSPSIVELADTWLSQIAHLPVAQQRYKDVQPMSLSEQGAASEQISASSVQHIQKLFRELANNEEAAASALGLFQTERTEAQNIVSATVQEDVKQYEWVDIVFCLHSGELVRKNPMTRMCYYPLEGRFLVFIDGCRWDAVLCSQTWLECLCSKMTLLEEDIVMACGDAQNETHVGNRHLLMGLLQQGAWFFDKAGD